VSRRPIVAVLVLLALVSCVALGGQASSAATGEPTVRYALYYGGGSSEVIDTLKNFELVIIEPQVWTDQQIRELQASGVTVVGYMPTLAIDQAYPHFTDLVESDYFHVDGQRVTNGDDWILDPRSTHLQDLITGAIHDQLYARGLDGVFLDVMDMTTDYLFSFVDRSAPGFDQLKTDMFAATTELAQKIHELDTNKVVVQNNGWRELKAYTAPYIDFLMWEAYPYDLGESNAWVNARRQELIDMRSQHGVQVLTLAQMSSGSTADNGFSPYVAWDSYGGAINTDGLALLPAPPGDDGDDTPPTPPDDGDDTPPTPPDDGGTTPPPPSDDGVPEVTLDNAAYYTDNAAYYTGPVNSQAIETLGRFQLAVVPHDTWSAADVAALQELGTRVIARFPTLVLDDGRPHLKGIRDRDYLLVNGQRVSHTLYGRTYYLLDPRSSRVKSSHRRAIENDVVDKGFDGVLLSDLEFVNEYLFSLTNLSEAELAALNPALRSSTVDLIRGIKDNNRSLFVLQQNGWRELIADTGSAVDGFLWMNYPYTTNGNGWLDARIEQVQSFVGGWQFSPVAVARIASGDAAAAEAFVADACADGFVAYAAWGSLQNATINTDYSDGLRAPQPDWGLQAQPVGSDVLLSWDETGDAFEIYAAPEGGSFKVVGTTRANQFIDTNDGEAVEYYVVADTGEQSETITYRP